MAGIVNKVYYFYLSTAPQHTEEWSHLRISAPESKTNFTTL